MGVSGMAMATEREGAEEGGEEREGAEEEVEGGRAR